MNVSNLSPNNVNIVSKLCNKTIVIYLSIAQCARGQSLSDPLKSDLKSESITLVSFTQLVGLDLYQAIKY